MSSPPLVADGLGKRFRRDWALRDLTLTIPKGAVVGLAGPNAAGKSTLLSLAAGVLAPSEGSISVLGADPLRTPEILGEVGYVAQGAPLYRSFRVEDTIEFARRTNSRWDREIAVELLTRIDSRAKVGALSAGERARLALALALGKRPRLVLLDEPFASLDPLAARELLQLLMDGVAELGATVVVASHVVADIQRVCDHIVLLTGGCVRLEGDVEELLESHRLLTGPRRPLGSIRGVREVVRERYSGRQLTMLVTTDGPIVDPSWTVDPVSLEELLLAYMAPERMPNVRKMERVRAAMAWVTWRQHWSQAVGALGLLVALAVAAVLTHLPIASAFDHDSLSACLPPAARTGCDIIVPHFESQFGGLVTATRVMAVLPALAGLFVGAPLIARELEYGTYRFAWTQGVSRRRWLLSKTALLAAGTVVAAGVASLVVMWWRAPFDTLEGRIGPSGFDIEGIVVPAYALFALALGVLAGLVFRRTVAAMTATLVAFGATRFLVSEFIRPHFMAPLHRVDLRDDDERACPATGC